ncbi:MAG: hypothetical protein HYU66_29285 [Armatimonadetes bacterium]|nr:hypothetical protein [Armatimonadota bacterium]
MAIQVRCAHCGAVYQVPDDKAGQSGKCRCGELMQVPAKPAAQAAPARPAEVRRPAAPTLAEAAGHERAGPMVECRHCGMKTHEGMECEWCHQPLGTAPPVPTLHRPAGEQMHERVHERHSGAVPGIVVVVLVLIGLSLLAIPVLAVAMRGAMLGFAAAMGVPPQAGIANFVLAVAGVTWLLSLGLFIGILKRSPAAYWIYLVLQILALLGGFGLAIFVHRIPYLSLINLTIVRFWCMPNCKDWFGV